MCSLLVFLIPKSLLGFTYNERLTELEHFCYFTPILAEVTAIYSGCPVDAQSAFRGCSMFLCDLYEPLANSQVPAPGRNEFSRHVMVPLPLLLFLVGLLHQNRA